MGKKGKKRRAQKRARRPPAGSVRAWLCEPASPRHLEPLLPFVLVGFATLLLALLATASKNLELKVILATGGVVVVAGRILWALAEEPKSARSRVWVRVDREGLHVDDELVPRAHLDGVRFEPDAGVNRHAVVVDRVPGGTLRFELASYVDAYEIVRKLTTESAEPPPPEPAPALISVPDPAPDPTPVRRRDRSLDGWLASLRALGSGAGADMRTAPVPRDRLLRIVEDEAAASIDRAAAAVALAAEVDDVERDRLRIVAEGADSRLRVVLDHAASEADDETMAAALAAVEAER